MSGNEMPPPDHPIAGGERPPAGGDGAATSGAFPVKAGDLALVFFLSVVAVQGLALLGGAAAGALNTTAEEDSVVWALLSILALQAVALFAVIHVVVLRRRNLAWADLGLRPATRPWFAKALGAIVLAFPLTWAVNGLVQVVLGRAVENPQLTALAPTGFSWIGLIGMLLLVGLVMPLAEEILFRGILYRWLRERMGILTAAAVSGLCFSVLHGVPFLIPAIALLGVILALLYEWSGSLWPSVTTHAVYNSASIVLLYGLLGRDAPVL